jgi:phage terminase large subunit
MSTIKVPNYTASERQTLFHTTLADEALYGGAAGGGKTAALVAEAVTIALEYPGIPVDIFRRTIPELKGTIIPEIYRQCGQYIEAGGMTYHGQDRKFLLKNGSSINLNYCDTDNDIYRYQGREIPILMIDELTQFPQAWFEYLKTRNRTSNPDWPVVVRACTNPGGIGHGWVKTYFIDSSPAEQINIDQETGLSRVFIPARVDDHPLQKFKEDYKKKLQAITDNQLRRALLEGDWDVFAGQVFKEFRREKHVVDPFTIPEHWQKWFGYDHGYNTWAAGLWFARDPAEDRVYIYRELYLTQTTVKEISSNIKLFDSNENINIRFADPAIWKGAGNQNTGETVAEMFSTEGIYFQPANNDRLAGKAAWHDMLSPHTDGKPKLQIFSSCVNLIRTLPSLPYDLHRVEDVDTKAEDHLYDAGRYALLNPRKDPPKSNRVRPARLKFHV